MFVLGISGGPDLIEKNECNISRIAFHDAAAVILNDGKVVCAIEEERLNRIKHTNYFPQSSIRECLNIADISATDVSSFAYYSTRDTLDAMLHYGRPAPVRSWRYPDPTRLLAQLIESSCGYLPPPERLTFVDHHVAHAASAFWGSGFEDALIVTMDGEGEGLSTTVSLGNADGIVRTKAYAKRDSLGLLYYEVTRFLGYEAFEEYKVMGLAPFGDPERFRGVFKKVVTLNDEGDFSVDPWKLHLLWDFLRPRLRQEPFEQIHKDLAAAVQEALESVALHFLKGIQRTSGMRNLCLAGGVAHNAAMNGRIMYSGIFENVYVQGASHDAGCALGAAADAYFTLSHKKMQPMRSMFFGRDLGKDAGIKTELLRWKEFIDIECIGDQTRKPAQLLADGKIIGWMQGRSEFGPRALGARSILADPRPRENWDRINQKIKMREGYRPFAPSVLAERANEFFDIKPGANMEFMSFVVQVRDEYRKVLGAVTHVDGTARVQVVHQEHAALYWQLISDFAELTGIPVLLNTSFNNAHEPIVDGIDDGVTCLLTTELDYLVAGQYLVTPKKPIEWRGISVRMAPHVRLTEQVFSRAEENNQPNYSLEAMYDGGARVEIRRELYEFLKAAGVNGKRHGKPDEYLAFSDELLSLWRRRMLVIKPCSN